MPRRAATAGALQTACDDAEIALALHCRPDYTHDHSFVQSSIEDRLRWYAARNEGSMTDRSIDPTADQVRALRDAGVDRPVVMLNLLKFRERAQYAENSGHPDCSGEEAYQRYQHVFTVAVGATSRAEVLYDGPVEQVFIGMAGTPETDWDKVLLVRYPSAKDFLAMMANEEYRATGLVHRYAGLERTVLLQCKG